MCYTYFEFHLSPESSTSQIQTYQLGDVGKGMLMLTANLAKLVLPLMLLMVLAVNVQATTFSESEFSPAGWQSIIVHSVDTGGSVTSTQQSGGNPGNHWRVHQIVNIPNPGLQSKIKVFNFDALNTYDPQSQGAITLIDAQLDYQTISDLQMGLGQSISACALRQNGVVYQAGSQATGNPPASWQTIQQLTLTSTDFVDVTGAPGHPDFSENGSVIEFGFGTSNTSGIGGAGRDTEVAYDNWSVTLVSPAQVPTLSHIGLGLLAILLIAAGLWSHGRRKRAEAVL